MLNREGYGGEYFENSINNDGPLLASGCTCYKPNFGICDNKKRHLPRARRQVDLLETYIDRAKSNLASSSFPFSSVPAYMFLR